VRRSKCTTLALTRPLHGEVMGQLPPAHAVPARAPAACRGTAHCVAALLPDPDMPRRQQLTVAWCPNAVFGLHRQISHPYQPALQWVKQFDLDKDNKDLPQTTWDIINLRCEIWHVACMSISLPGLKSGLDGGGESQSGKLAC